MVGETSLSLATACFGKEMNGNNGYDGNDILYIAFPGSDAVPGAKGALWNAKNYTAFEASIRTHGDVLIARIGNNSSGNCTGSSGYCHVPTSSGSLTAVGSLWMGGQALLALIMAVALIM